nr:TOBE domain-containing protein [Bacillus sp. REN10]
MNIIDMDVDQDKLTLVNQTLQLSFEWNHYIQQIGERELAFGIRPEHITLSKTPIKNGLKGHVKYVENHGNSYGIYIDLEGNELIAMSESKKWLPNELVYVEPRMDKIHMFNKQTTNSIGYPESLNE